MSVRRSAQTIVIRAAVAILIASGTLLAAGPTAPAGEASAPLPLDSDGDGCSDAEELGPEPALGGLRDPANPYDFYDVPFRDQSVSALDLFMILLHFSATAAGPGGPPRYDPAFDRSSPSPGGNPWDLQAPDGAISGLDIFAVLGQFSHECSEIPPFYSIADPAFAASHSATALYGTYSGGAYKIEVPDAWNGDLILYSHGFRGNSGTLIADTLPFWMRGDVLARGYAWASSSFRANGYDPGFGARDTLSLKDLFTYLVGAPNRTFLLGGSMGGNVVTLSLEQAPGEYDGALALCGAVAGVEILDYFAVTWPAVGGFVTGVAVDIETATTAELRQALEDIHTALGGPGAYSQAGQQFKSIIVNYTGGPRPFDSEGFDQWYEFTFLLLTDALNAQEKNLPTAVMGQEVASNDGVFYHIDPGLGLTDEEINAGVQRVAADPAAQANSEFGEFMPMSGQISAPLMSLHGTGDYYVPISMDVSYLQKVQAAGKSDLLVQRAYRHADHCAFSSQDVMDAFDDLVNWVDTGIKPWGDDLSGDLSDIGR